MQSAPKRGERGSALLVTVMLLMMLGLVGLAALGTTTRDQQVAGFQNRKRMALYAADAGIAEALERLTTTSVPSVSTLDLGDTTIFPYGRPSYRPDPTTASPTKDLGNAPFPGMGLNLGQGGLPTYQINYWRLRVQGLAPGGTQAKVEAVSGSLAAN
jgi:Tfp pilus assembly protein PilX